MKVAETEGPEEMPGPSLDQWRKEPAVESGPGKTWGVRGCREEEEFYVVPCVGVVPFDPGSRKLLSL